MAIGKATYLITWGTWKKHAGEFISATCLPLDRELEPHQFSDATECVVVVETHDALHQQLEKVGTALPHIADLSPLPSSVSLKFAHLGIEDRATSMQIHRVLSQHHPAFHPRNL